MASGESLHGKVPGYRVDLEPCSARVVARCRGEVVADSRRTLRVRESRHTPVFYLPRDDVRLDLLDRTDHSSFCPFKGDASYWSLRVDGHEEENVVWSYEDPFEEVAGLKHYMAFHPGRVDLEELP
jgi:uncharacterized protein (DUF427 family)